MCRILHVRKWSGVRWSGFCEEAGACSLSRVLPSCADLANVLRGSFTRWLIKKGVRTEALSKLCRFGIPSSCLSYNHLPSFARRAMTQHGDTAVKNLNTSSRHAPDRRQEAHRGMPYVHGANSSNFKRRAARTTASGGPTR